MNNEDKNKEAGPIEEEKSVKKGSEEASAGALSIQNSGREKKVKDMIVHNCVEKEQNMILRPALDRA